MCTSYEAECTLNEHVLGTHLLVLERQRCAPVTKAVRLLKDSLNSGALHNFVDDFDHQN
jgi:hypothetical protein